MERTAENFITAFHSLKGVTIAERKRNLYQLFSENPEISTNHQMQSLITERLVPENHLENLFLVEYLIYYKCVQELAQQFQNGNEIIVSKILKQNWFFQAAFNQIGPEYVYEILPQLGYNIRLKLLKKLSIVLNEQQNDAIFDALFEKYGIFIATNVLTGCSALKIENILKNHPVKLWTRHLKQFYKKNPALIEIYFEERTKLDGNSNFLFNEEIIRFLASQNTELFCKLLQKYKVTYFKLGKRTTRKVVKEQRLKLVENPEIYLKNLKSNTFVRKIGTDFPKIYKKTLLEQFPNCINSMRYENLLNYYPKSRQFQLFQQTYDEISHKKLVENISDFHDGIFKLIQNGEEREFWAQTKIKQSKHTLNSCYKYYTAGKCYEILSKRLETSKNLTQRVEIISIITESCIINRDFDVFLQVSQLICNRLRNDNKSLAGKFLEVLTNTKNQNFLENLSKNHWDLIVSLILRKEFRVDKLYTDCTPILFAYLHFLITKNESIFDTLERFLKNGNFDTILDESNFKFCTSTSQRTILLGLIKMAPSVLSQNQKIEHFDCHLLLAVKKFNEKNRQKNQLDLFDNNRLLQSLQKLLEEEVLFNSELLGEVTVWVICRPNLAKNPKISILETIYWKRFNELGNVFGIKWFLKHRPQQVVKNLDSYLTRLFPSEFHFDFYVFYKFFARKIWNVIKCYSHLKMDSAAVNFFLSKLEDSQFEHKNDVIKPLSLLMPPSEFLKLVKNYIPTTFKVDMTNSHLNSHFQLQKHFLYCLKYVKTDPNDLFTIIMEFYSGDYVGPCLTSLNSVVYKLGYVDLYPKLQFICKMGPVSARKHGYFYICNVFDQKTVFETIEKCNLSQSIATCFNFFKRNPTETSWNVFKTKIEKLDKNDVFTSLILVNSPIPINYKSQYLEIVYTVMDKQNNKFCTVLLDKTQKETVKNLSTVFLHYLESKFLTLDKLNKIFAYLLLSGEKRHIELVCKNLQKFKVEKWGLKQYEPRHIFSKFIKSFFNLYIEDSTKNDELLLLIDIVLNEMSKIFKPYEIFEDYILILMLKLKNQSLEDFSRILIQLNNFLVEQYGEMTVDIFANLLLKHSNKFFTDSKDWYVVCLNVLKEKQSISDVLLVIHLFPKEEPVLEDSYRIYQQVLDDLKKIDNDLIKLYVPLILST